MVLRERPSRPQLSASHSIPRWLYVELLSDEAEKKSVVCHIPAPTIRVPGVVMIIRRGTS